MTQTATTGPLLSPVPETIRDARTAEREVATIAQLVDRGHFAQASRREAALHIAALEAIAGCNAQAAGIAQAVLATRKIDFPRTGAL